MKNHTEYLQGGTHMKMTKKRTNYGKTIQVDRYDNRFLVIDYWGKKLVNAISKKNEDD